MGQLLTPVLTGIVRRLAGVAPSVGLAGALVWAANIYFLSSTTVSFGEKGPYHAWLSNFAHAPVYGILAILVFLALPRPRADDPARAAPRFTARRAVLVVAITVLYGISDELHQSFTPGRDASLCDILTDLCGASLCAASLVTLAVPSGSRGFGRVLALGLSACVLVAWIATEVPNRFPELPWL